MRKSRVPGPGIVSNCSMGLIEEVKEKESVRACGREKEKSDRHFYH